MDLLTAVNHVLPSLGEHTVTSVEARHPTLAIILPIIDLKRKEVLMRGWWFNEGKYTATPDVNSNIFMPQGTLGFLPECVNASVRKLKLYNLDTRNYIWTSSVTGMLMEDIPFDELPESVATYVFYEALVQTYVTDIGLESVVSKWQEYASTAAITASQEHLRNKKYSTRRSRKYGNYISALRG